MTLTGRPAGGAKLRALALWALAATAHAAIIPVDSFSDDYDQGPNGNCTLREAVFAANRDAPVDGCAGGSGADRIEVPAGTYIVRAQDGGGAGTSGTLPLASEVTIAGAGADRTFVTSNGIGGAVFTLPLDDTAAPAIALEGLTITSEETHSAWAIVDTGRGPLTIKDCHVTGGYGGLTDQQPAAPYVPGPAAAVHLVDSTVDGASFYGLQVRYHDLVVERSTVSGNYRGVSCASCRIADSTIDGNTAVALSLGVGEAVVSGSTFRGNTQATIVSGGHQSLTIQSSRLAGNGGAPSIVFVGVTTLPTFLTIEDTTIEKNAGGGIQVLPGGPLFTLRMARTRVSDNGADAETGGGVVLVHGYDCLITDSTISGNHAAAGGGGLALDGVGIRLVNSTISGNRASRGGGIYISNPGTEIELSNVTIAENEASRGGSAVYVDTDDPIDGSSLVFRNALVSGDCAAAPQPGPFVTKGGNVEGPGNSCRFNLPTDRHAVARLGLGPLADNGGPTPTHALRRVSPAIDVGVRSHCPAADQRGEPRPIDGNRDGLAECDAGAFERQR